MNDYGTWETQFPTQESFSSFGGIGKSKKIVPEGSGKQSLNSKRSSRFQIFQDVEHKVMITRMHTNSVFLFSSNNYILKAFFCNKIGVSHRMMISSSKTIMF